MADNTVQMTAPNGAKVTVAADRVESLTLSGFTAETKAPAKKAASKKSEK